MPLLGEPRIFEAAKAVVEACVEAGILREATDLVRAIVRRKKLLSEEHNKALQDLLMHALGQWCTCAHAFSAGDQHEQFTATPQFQQHLHGHCSTPGEQRQGCIALI